MAWVVGLIIPIVLAPVSVNQRLPSGPAVIPSGRRWRSGMVNKLIACVVGLIIPIALAPGSVNQRLPSGPVVIPSSCGPGHARERKLGDARKCPRAGNALPALRAGTVPVFGSGRRIDGLSERGRSGPTGDPGQRESGSVGENRENMVLVSIEKAVVGEFQKRVLGPRAHSERPDPWRSFA